jgi:hypothetical protein
MNSNENIDNSIDFRIEELFVKISTLIESAKKNVVSSINTNIIYANYETGRYIVEYEQRGSFRAEYGKAILQKLSDKLTLHFGKGWSVENLTLCRKFYLVYSKNQNFVNTDYEIENNSKINQISNLPFTLSWSHYLILMRIDNPEERRFLC